MRNLKLRNIKIEEIVFGEILKMLLFGTVLGFRDIENSLWILPRPQRTSLDDFQATWKI